MHAQRAPFPIVPGTTFCAQPTPAQLGARDFALQVRGWQHVAGTQSSSVLHGPAPATAISTGSLTGVGRGVIGLASTSVLGSSSDSHVMGTIARHATQDGDAVVRTEIVFAGVGRSNTTT